MKDAPGSKLYDSGACTLLEEVEEVPVLPECLSWYKHISRKHNNISYYSIKPLDEGTKIVYN